jgi:hypothetical protein
VGIHRHGGIVSFLLFFQNEEGGIKRDMRNSEERVREKERKGEKEVTEWKKEKRRP